MGGGGGRGGGEAYLQFFCYSSKTIGARLLKLCGFYSTAEKCYDIWSILKMASVKSFEPWNNCFRVNHNTRCRYKLLPLGFSKSVLVLIL